jgi:hypothetical protein
MPRRLLRPPTRQDRFKQRLLQPERPHALAEQARERSVDLGGAIPPLSACSTAEIPPSI